jgi:preprotein translocase subunit YajC
VVVLVIGGAAGMLAARKGAELPLADHACGAVPGADNSGSNSLVHFLVDGWQRTCVLAQAAEGGGLESIFGSMAIPLAFTLLLMYFLLMRPEQKKRKDMEKLLAGIKKNDHVVTIGGIYGTVVATAADSKFVTLRVDDSTGTKLKVLRSAISHVGGPEEAEIEGKPRE